MPADWTERAARRAAPKDRAMATMVIDVVVGAEMVWGWNEGAMDGGVGKDGEKNARGVEGELGRAYVSRALSAGPNRRTSRSPRRQSISIVCAVASRLRKLCDSRPSMLATMEKVQLLECRRRADSQTAAALPVAPAPALTTTHCTTHCTTNSSKLPFNRKNCTLRC
jgi:hypothetical protein